MTPVPLDLPVRPAEAAELARLIFENAERKPLTDELRTRLAGRASILRLETIRPHFGSLARDPIHPSTYYLAIDGLAMGDAQPLLLHIAPAAAPTSSVFYKPLLIGRMRPSLGPEVVINSVPFGPNDRDTVEKFANLIDTAVLPRPLGSRPAICVNGNLRAAFDAFRVLQKRTGKNLASTSAGYAESLAAAIRAGWRDGYGVGVEVVDAASVHESAVFTRFRFGLPDGARERALELAAQTHESIREARSTQKLGRSFDFELSLEAAPAPTTAGELAGCLEALQACGHAAQLVAPRLDGTASLADLAAVAQQYRCLLSIGSQPGHTAEVLEAIGAATAGRLLYRWNGEHEDIASRIAAIAGRLF